MGKKIDNRPDTSGDITEDDIKIAEGLIKDGIALPPDLKAAYDAHKKSNDTTPPAQGGDSHDDDDEAKAKKEANDKKKAEDEAAAEIERKRKELEDGGGSGDSKPPTPRPVQSVPLPKYLETEKRAKTAEEKVIALETQLNNLPAKSDEDYEKEVTELAAGLGLEVAEVKKLDAFFAKRHQLPPEALAAIKQVQQTKDQETFWEQQFSRFDTEFAAELDTLKKSDPNEAALMESNKEKIKELAFTDGYNNRSIWELHTRFVKTAVEPNRKTVESPAGGSAGAGGGGRDWAKVSADPAAIRALSKAEFEEFDKWLIAQQGGSRLRPAKRA